MASALPGDTDQQPAGRHPQSRQCVDQVAFPCFLDNGYLIDGFCHVENSLARRRLFERECIVSGNKAHAKARYITLSVYKSFNINYLRLDKPELLYVRMVICSH